MNPTEFIDETFEDFDNDLMQDVEDKLHAERMERQRRMDAVELGKAFCDKLRSYGLEGVTDMAPDAEEVFDYQQRFWLDDLRTYVEVEACLGSLTICVAEDETGRRLAEATTKTPGDPKHADDYQDKLRQVLDVVYKSARQTIMDHCLDALEEVGKKQEIIEMQEGCQG